MTLDEALKFTDKLLLKQRKKGITTLERGILTHSWNEGLYVEPLKNLGRSAGHLRQTASNLWKILNKYFEQLQSLEQDALLLGKKEKVEVGSVRTIYERYGDYLSGKNLPPATVIDLALLKKSSVQVDRSVSKIKEAVSTTVINQNKTQNSPNTSIEYPYGPVKLNSKFYINRLPIESDCYQAILEPRALIRIFGPRQIGKTSLIRRILARGEQEGYYIVSIDFQSIDTKICQDLNELLRSLCSIVGRKLNLENQIEKYWNLTLGSKESCRIYFEEYIFNEITQPIVIAFDKIDYLLSYPEVADNFYSMLRFWHDAGDDIPAFENFRLVLAYTESISVNLNVNESPFNVGLPIELPEFSPEQVAELAARHDLSWNDADIEKIMKIFGGQPFPLRHAMYDMIKHNQKLNDFFNQDLTQIKPYSSFIKKRQKAQIRGQKVN